MQSSPSSSGSNAPSSSSSNSLVPKSLRFRLETIFRKAYELSTLCDIEVCVIHYGPYGELKTWPEERGRVRDMALRYSQLDEATRRKKSVDLYGFLKKKKKKKKTTTVLKKKKTTVLKKKKKTKKNGNELKYPISDHYSPDQISQLIQSLELSFSTLQERLRFVEAQKQRKTKLDHQGLTPPLSLNHHHQDHHQTQSLNPSQFTLFIYNHGDATLSQIPFSASDFNQSVSTQFTNYTALLQEYGLKNHLMHQELYGCDQNDNFQHLCVSNTKDHSALPAVKESGLENHLMQTELYGCDQNMCMGNINSNNIQHPCVSNTQDYSALQEVQESVNNCGLNQHELHGYDQNMSTSDITNSNVLDPCVSNTVSDDLCSDFEVLYGNMVGNSSFPQDFPDMPTSYDVHFDERSLLQTSTLPSLHTVPNSYFIS